MFTSYCIPLVGRIMVFRSQTITYGRRRVVSFRVLPLDRITYFLCNHHHWSGSMTRDVLGKYRGINNPQAKNIMHPQIGINNRYRWVISHTTSTNLHRFISNKKQIIWEKSFEPTGWKDGHPFCVICSRISSSVIYHQSR